MNKDKTIQLINWYLETNPTLQDLENEIEYQNIDMSTSDFINFAKTGKYTIKLDLPEYLKVFLNSEGKK